MLLQFTVENFLSFRDETVVRFTPAPGVEHRPGQRIRGGEHDALRIAAFYGANASGKSNLFKALRFVRDLVVNGRRKDEPVGPSPFRLVPKLRDQPSKFELEIVLGTTRWSYGVACSAQRIEAEWLYRDSGDGEELLFTREASTAGEDSKFELGDILTSASGDSTYPVLTQLTAPNQAFLFRLSEHPTNLTGALWGWFARSLVLIGADQGFPNLAKALAEHTDLRVWVSELLNRAGTGITAVVPTLRDGSPTFARFIRDVAAQQVKIEPFNAFLEQLSSTIAQAPADELDLSFVHKVPAGDQADLQVPFQAHEESDGTLRLLHLSPHLAGLRPEGQPATVFIDELDRSLHSLLTRRLIELYLQQPEDRPNQLLFTTHDTNLLDAGLLSPDSIYFVEKDTTGASTVYSLAEFKPEQLDKLQGTWERGYLQGRFGAIPFLGDPMRLGWTKEST